MCPDPRFLIAESDPEGITDRSEGMVEREPGAFMSQTVELGR